MANGVVLEDLKKYQKLLKTSKSWKCAPFMILVLLFPSVFIAFFAMDRLFGGVNGESMWAAIAASILATIPIGVHLFWSQSVNARINKVGAKLLDDLYGERWLPNSASTSFFDGTVYVTMHGGQVLSGDLEEIVVGRGKWSTNKQVQLSFNEAIEWYDQYPPPAGQD